MDTAFWLRLYIAVCFAVVHSRSSTASRRGVNTVFREHLFDGKVALVTGGATGIGLRIARELAKLGATVVIASRKEENLTRGRKIIEAEGGRVFTEQLNIRSAESIEKCIDNIIAKHGGIDLLVNNAGGQFPGLLESFKVKGWRSVIDLNLTGPFLVSQTVLKKCFRSKKRKGAAIVNILAYTRSAFPLFGHTAAARAGMENLTKTMSVEWAKYGVRVNSVAPGTTDSGALEKYPAFVKDIVDAAGTYNYMYRHATVAEVAGAVTFLLSPAASFITGETIQVQGATDWYSPAIPPTKDGLKVFPKFDDEIVQSKL